MGVDVNDIEVVVQWCIPSHLNLSGFWQRAGRCARNLDVQGCAILYYNIAIDATLSKVGAPGLEIYMATHDADQAAEIMSNIQKFDEGIREHLEPIEMPENNMRQSPTATTYVIRGSPMADSQTPTTPVPAARHEDSDVGSDGGGENRRHIAIPAQEDLEITAQDFETPLELDISEPKTVVVRDGTEVLKTVDRALLWFINTKGCRRKIIMKYFTDTTYGDPSANDPRCCDRCHARLYASHPVEDFIAISFLRKLGDLRNSHEPGNHTL